MISPDAWYRQMPGLMVLTEEKIILDRLLKKYRGNTVLQIGGAMDDRLTEALVGSKIIFVDAFFHRLVTKPLIQADCAQLPIASDSIDVVLLMHQLEMTSHPQEILQEIQRVLKPNGKLILFCFNCLSVWHGFFLCRQKAFPMPITCYFASTIKKYLRRLGFQIDQRQSLCFRPPFSQKETAKRWLFLETLGHMIFPGRGGVFMLAAHKRVLGITPLRSTVWKKTFDADWSAI